MNFFLFSLFSEGIEAEIQLIDRVIAVVDSSVIMESELNNRVEEIIGRLRSDGTELPQKKTNFPGAVKLRLAIRCS